MLFESFFFFSRPAAGLTVTWIFFRVEDSRSTCFVQLMSLLKILQEELEAPAVLLPMWWIKIMSHSDWNFCKCEKPPFLLSGSTTVTISKTPTCTRTSRTGRASRTTRNPIRRGWRRARRVTVTRQSDRTTPTLTWIPMNTCGRLRTWSNLTRSWGR